MGKFVYRFTGETPETFPSLSGVLGAGTVDEPADALDAELEPGEEISLDAPIQHARLEPVSSDAKKAAAEFDETAEHDTPTDDVVIPPESDEHADDVGDDQE